MELKRDGQTVITVGSKADTATSSRILYDEDHRPLSLREADEIYAINVTENIISHFSFCTTTLSIYADSFAAIKKLNSNIFSKTKITL